MSQSSSSSVMSLRRFARDTRSTRPGPVIRADRNAPWPFSSPSSPTKERGPIVAITASSIHHSESRTTSTSPDSTRIRS